MPIAGNDEQLFATALRARAYVELFQGRALDARDDFAEAACRLEDRDEISAAVARADAALATPRETRIALEVTAGATNTEVAARLFLSPKTVEVIYR